MFALNSIFFYVCLLIYFLFSIFYFLSKIIECIIGLFSIFMVLSLRFKCLYSFIVRSKYIFIFFLLALLNLHNNHNKIYNFSMSNFMFVRQVFVPIKLATFSDFPHFPHFPFNARKSCIFFLLLRVDFQKRAQDRVWANLLKDKWKIYQIII